VSRRAGRALLVALALALTLSACTLELDVNVEVEADGSGAVEVVAALDAEAVARVGGDLEAVLALDGLRADGWSVDGPTTGADGRTTLRLRQPFAEPGAADEVFADVAGVAGPFRDLRVERERSLLETRWRFAGTVDLGGDVPVRGAARPAVESDPLAETLGQLEAQLGESLERVLRLRVGVRLPGDVESNATTRAENGAVWSVGFGEAPLALEATGRSTRWGVVALLALAGVAAVVALVALLVRLAGRVTDGPRGGASGRRGA
jgi:hypothetical protein